MGLRWCGGDGEDKSPTWTVLYTELAQVELEHGTFVGNCWTRCCSQFEPNLYCSLKACPVVTARGVTQLSRA